MAETWETSPFFTLYPEQIAQMVLEAYKSARPQDAFEMALRAYCARNPNVSLEAARRAVARIICNEG